MTDRSENYDRTDYRDLPDDQAQGMSSTARRPVRRSLAQRDATFLWASVLYKGEWDQEVERLLSIEEFIDRSSRRLLRSAWLLTGNWASAEDLVQTALLQSWLHWEAIKSDAPEFYVRAVLMNTFLSGQRRRWTSERSVAELPDRAAFDEVPATELRHVIWSALSALPARQRAVVVLRYYDDLSEAEAARVLDCSVGTVKSQTSRALAKLRSAPELQSLLEEVGHE